MQSARAFFTPAGWDLPFHTKGRWRRPWEEHSDPLKHSQWEALGQFSGILLACSNGLGLVRAGQGYTFPFGGRPGQVPGFVLIWLSADLGSGLLAWPGTACTRPPSCCRGCWRLTVLCSWLFLRNRLFGIGKLKWRPDL